MIELNSLFTTLYANLESTMSKLGFSVEKPENYEKGTAPVFTRDNATYIAYSGEKGKVRILFNDNKIRLLVADKDAKSEDDSEYSLLASFLVVLEEYDARDLKSTVNEIIENIEEAYSQKQIAKRKQNIKAQATVSRAAVKSGALVYDAATLAIRLAEIYPEIKEEYKEHLCTYDEFLCEDFFTKHVNPLVHATIRENNPQKMKKLFGILNEIYDDGSNEVQDVIIVTILGSCNYQGDMMKNVLGYVNDSILEPFVRVNKILKSSKSARLRLENPPKYKPKKSKKKKPGTSILQK
ncbi:MAG: hypothetical protein IKV76_03630 [Clostridia bacterium]|nr:hypothetical protein [Clostridia bacterium]